MNLIRRPPTTQRSDGDACPMSSQQNDESIHVHYVSAYITYILQYVLRVLIYDTRSTCMRNIGSLNSFMSPVAGRRSSPQPDLFLVALVLCVNIRRRT